MDRLTHENNVQALGEMRRGADPEVLEDIGIKLVDATVGSDMTPLETQGHILATAVSEAPSTQSQGSSKPNNGGNYRVNRWGDGPPEHVQEQIRQHRGD